MKTQPNVTFGENKPTTGTENYPEPTCMLWVTTKGEKNKTKQTTLFTFFQITLYG